MHYDKDFSLWMTTKIGNPQFPPEIEADVTLINFVIMQDGLTEQLLVSWKNSYTRFKAARRVDCVFFGAFWKNRRLYGGLQTSLTPSAHPFRVSSTEGVPVLQGIVVMKEEPSLEAHKHALVQRLAEGRKRLQDIEDQILRLLTSARGYLLDDLELIRVLQVRRLAALVHL